MKKTFLIIAAVLWQLSTAQANDYYVNATTGSNTPGNGTQTKPWKTISYALSQITGTGHRIYVAAGTYDTVMDGVFPEVFPLLLRNGISLIGAKADSTIVDAKKSNSVIRCENITDTTVVIQGLTIRNGNSGLSNGGGIRLISSSPKIQNNIFEGNEGSSGGAIHVNGGSVMIRNNIFRNNNSSDGGGIGFSQGDIQIVQNQFIGNRAAFEGGAIYLSPSGFSKATAKIVENVFISNSVNFNGPSIAIGFFNSQFPPYNRSKPHPQWTLLRESRCPVDQQYFCWRRHWQCNNHQ